MSKKAKWVDVSRSQSESECFSPTVISHVKHNNREAEAKDKSAWHEKTRLAELIKDSHDELFQV